MSDLYHTGWGCSWYFRHSKVSEAEVTTTNVRTKALRRKQECATPCSEKSVRSLRRNSIRLSACVEAQGNLRKTRLMRRLKTIRNQFRNREKPHRRRCQSPRASQRAKDTPYKAAKNIPLCTVRTSATNCQQPPFLSLFVPPVRRRLWTRLPALCPFPTGFPPLFRRPGCSDRLRANG